MATKTKNCKRCREDKPVKDFVRSAVAKSGRLGYCTECWSKMVSPKNRKNKHRPKAIRERSAGPRKSADRTKVSVANEALKQAGAVKEHFLVRTQNEGKADFAEFASEEKALRQAMDWKLQGFPVTVWRQCEFEMVLRIIG